MKRLEVETLNPDFEGHLQISLLSLHEKVNQVYFPRERIPEIPYPRLETVAAFTPFESHSSQQCMTTKISAQSC